MKTSARRFFVILLLALAADGSAAPPLPGGVTQGSTVEGITEYGLPNGLRVLFAPDSSKPTTTVNTTYLVGSRNESYGETGMAHLLEHLMFKGTPAYPMVWNEFTRRGRHGIGLLQAAHQFEPHSILLGARAQLFQVVGLG